MKIGFNSFDQIDKINFTFNSSIEFVYKYYRKPKKRTIIGLQKITSIPLAIGIIILWDNYEFTYSSIKGKHLFSIRIGILFWNIELRFNKIYKSI